MEVMTRRKRKSRKPRTRFSIEDKKAIAQIQGQIGLFGIVCKRCGREFPIDIMQVDHIIPVSKGGTDRPTNLQLLCPTCNLRKGAKKPSRPKQSARPYWVNPLTGKKEPLI